LPIGCLKSNKEFIDVSLPEVSSSNKNEKKHKKHRLVQMTEAEQERPTDHWRWAYAALKVVPLHPKHGKYSGPPTRLPEAEAARTHYLRIAVPKTAT